MRSSLAVVAVLAAAGALAVATAGAPFSDQLGDSEITLENASGPNGVYAVEQDGELAIRITETRQELAADGVNPNGVTVIEDIFRITYGGNENAEIWIETGVEDVEFRTETGSIEGPKNAVTLERSDRSVLVGLRIDTTGDHDVERIEEFTIGANVTDGASAREESDETDDPGEDDPEEDTGEQDEQSDPPGSGDTDGPGDPGDESGENEETGGGTADAGGEAVDDGLLTGLDEATPDPGTAERGDADDGATDDDGTTGLAGTGQPSLFEPAQTIGGFLPQLLGLFVAIAAGAGLFALVRRTIGSGEG